MRSSKATVSNVAFETAAGHDGPIKLLASVPSIGTIRTVNQTHVINLHHATAASLLDIATWACYGLVQQFKKHRLSVSCTGERYVIW